MKQKLLSLLLTAALLLPLIACAAAGPEAASVPEAKADEAPPPPQNIDSAPEAEPEPEPAEVIPALDLTGVNTLETVEFQLVDFFTAEDVLPPMPDSFYTHYAADAGKTYAVASFDVKNTQTAALSADELLACILTVGGIDYDGLPVVVSDGGSNLDNGAWTELQPLETARVYYLFSVPQNSDFEAMRLIAAGAAEGRIADLRLSDFVSRRKTFSVGQTFEDEAALKATVESVSYADTLYPPMPASYYRYYEAGAGKTYLILKLTAQNFKSNDLKCSEIAGVSCVYDGKYHYSAFATVEDDNGGTLNAFPAQRAVSPLDTAVVYYLCEMPAEVQTGSVEIALYILGQTYYLTYAP